MAFSVAIGEQIMSRQIGARSWLRRGFLLWCAGCLLLAAHTAQSAENIILVTLDGLRWQELYRGLDDTLARHPDYSEQSELILEAFWRSDVLERARTLMPFMHNTVFAQGTHVGNRDAGSCARLSNPWYFSFPGYSEILTGVVNPAIDSNAKRPNPERTLLELVEALPDFRGRTAAFASWDVFPYIFNVERSGLPVNAMGSPVVPVDATESLLLTLSEDIPPPWTTVRHDAFTHHYALSALRNRSPRVLFVSYGETDDFAHDGHYDQYILAAHRTDRFISELWDTVQSLEQYRDKTALFITVDHGRGEVPLESWQHHASALAVQNYMQSLARYENGVAGSENIWMAAMGAGIPSRGLLAAGDDACLTADRIASTVLSLLGLDYRSLNPHMGQPMQEFLP
jgi:hypothetical protein